MIKLNILTFKYLFICYTAKTLKPHLKTTFSFLWMRAEIVSEWFFFVLSAASVMLKFHIMIIGIRKRSWYENLFIGYIFSGEDGITAIFIRCGCRRWSCGCRSFLLSFHSLNSCMLISTFNQNWNLHSKLKFNLSILKFYKLFKSHNETLACAISDLV